MRRLCICATSALVLSLAGCSDTPAPVDKAAVEKSVREVESNMAKAVVAKDAGAFASNYTTDAIMMTPGEPPMKGRDAIKAGMVPMLADPATKLDFSSDRVEVATSGDMAATHGTYSLTVTDPATKKIINDHGSYVTVLRKQADGAWKAVLDINTSDAPPTPPPAPKSAARPTKKKGRKR